MPLDLRAALIATTVAASIGCASSLAGHARTIGDPAVRREVERALDDLDRLDRDGWVRRVARGDCARTYRRGPAETRYAQGGDVIGDLDEVVQDAIETTPAACRDALDQLDRIALTRMRLETEPAATGAVGAFRGAAGERGALADECPSDGDDLRAVVAAIVRHEHEMTVSRGGSVALSGEAASCRVITLGGPITIGPRAPTRRDPRDAAVRGFVQRATVLRGDVLRGRQLPGSEPRTSMDERAGGESTSTFDTDGPWLDVPAQSPWASSPAVYVELVRSGSVDAYVVILAADGWRLVASAHVADF